MSFEELEVKVYGRVQGVNFRRTVQGYAKEKGLKGCVFNRADGSVEIIIQGEKKVLSEFLSWIQTSPGFSKIKGLYYQWRDPSREFLEFKIIRDESYFVDKAKSLINLGKFIFQKGERIVPKHIAIIPDGNRRWAKKKGVAPQFGHYTSASLQHLRELFEEARKEGVFYLTLWGFSTENWKRNKIEINAIFDMILKSVNNFREEAQINKIRFRHFGRRDRLPKELVQALEDLEKKTKGYTDFNVQLRLDYGGNDEILRAINKILKKKIKKIDEKTFEENLDSAGVPPVDLIIRTSGEKRTSGFMPFQSAYAEFYFTDLHFPDFTASELKKAIDDFGNRNRRFGGDSGKK